LVTKQPYQTAKTLQKSHGLILLVTKQPYQTAKTLQKSHGLSFFLLLAM